MELNKKLNSVKNKVMKEFGEDVDFLAVYSQDDTCGLILHGDSHQIAHSLFATIHSDKEVSNDIYRIIKLVTLNIIGNETPYATDLINSILNICVSVQESDEGKAMCIDINQE